MGKSMKAVIIFILIPSLVVGGATLIEQRIILQGNNQITKTSVREVYDVITENTSGDVVKQNNELYAITTFDRKSKKDVIIAYFNTTTNQFTTDSHHAAEKIKKILDYNHLTKYKIVLDINKNDVRSAKTIFLKEDIGE